MTGHDRPLLLAHRGDARGVPENTLEAFRLALANPACDGLELDLRLSADGLAVVLHDASLERVFGRTERPRDLAASELAAIGVPSLADVLAAVPADAFLDAELKEDLGEAAVGPLRAARGLPDGGLSRAAVSSFDPAALVSVHRLAPAWSTWLITLDLSEATLGTALASGCTGVAARVRSIDAASAARVHEAGLYLAAWTVRDRAEVVRLARLGVAAVCVEGEALDG